jgi:3-oxoadipate enol-lactonase
MPIIEQSIETTRGRTAWLEAGRGWPLVLIHGFPLSAEMWRPQLERAPIGWRFVAPDLRGFGRSPLPDGPVTVDDYAADIGALLDALTIEDAVIGGLSLGGYVTFALHRQAPARFTRMILADTRATADTPHARNGRLALRRLLVEQGMGAVAAQLLPTLFSPGVSPAVRAAARAQIESAAPEAVDAAIGALIERPDSTPDLARVDCAALVVVGEEDAITPVADAEAMQRDLRRSTLTIVAGAGHLANLEQPEAFSRTLADFLISAL